MALEQLMTAPVELVWLLLDTIWTTPAHLVFLAFSGLVSCALLVVG
jgi:hypothetical protein